MKKQHQKKRKRGTRKKTNSRSKPKISQVAEKESTGIDKEVKRKPPQIISKKEPEKGREEKNVITRSIDVAVQFLRESRAELKMVKWPTRKELLASTAIVIFLVIAVSLYLGLVDFGLIRMIKSIVG